MGFESDLLNYIVGWLTYFSVAYVVSKEIILDGLMVISKSMGRS